MNELKEKLSNSYVNTLVSKLNYGFQPTLRSLDNKGIDAIIHGDGVGTGAMINVQIKGVSISSASMLRENELSISYNLTDAYERIAQPAYLFVVVFPSEEEIENWCTVEPDKLLLHKCAYFVKLPQRRGFIDIPKENVLNERTLPTLFIKAEDKEALL